MPGNKTGQRDKRETDRRQDMLAEGNYECENLRLETRKKKRVVHIIRATGKENLVRDFTRTSPRIKSNNVNKEEEESESD